MGLIKMDIIICVKWKWNFNIECIKTWDWWNKNNIRVTLLIEQPNKEKIIKIIKLSVDKYTSKVYYNTCKR